MREILFRGKRIDNGEWVYGDLVHIGNKSYISYYYESALSTFINETIEYDGISIVGVAPFIEVDPTTVGQYTGLTDKNGKKIFEGDIIFDPEMKDNYIVEFDEGGFCAGDMFLQAYISFDEFSCEVIGNIHDNPELLEDKQ